MKGRVLAVSAHRMGQQKFNFHEDSGLRALDDSCQRRENPTLSSAMGWSRLSTFTPEMCTEHVTYIQPNQHNAFSLDMLGNGQIRDTSL